MIDFKDGSIFRCSPRHRISFSTKLPLRAFDGASADAISFFVKAFASFVDDGGQSIKGTALEAMLSEIRSTWPRSLYSVFWQIFECDDMAMWTLRQCCRGCAGFELLEEFLLFFDKRGQNGTILNLLRLALGDYYATCPYKGGLVDVGGGGNNDKLAKCQGKRVVSCNEAFTRRDVTMEFDARNIKTLIGLDDPIETMAKYKAPVEWRGQALLIVSSNVLPTFPADDGGLSTRISLLRFPFSFVPRPEGDQTDRPTEPGLRWQDPSVKLSLMGTLVPEFFFWCRLLNQQLAAQRQTGRVLMPRPAKVDAETAELFKSGALVSPAGEDESTLLSMLREFDMLHMVEVPADTNSQRGGTPATCGQVELAFYDFVRAKGVEATKDATTAFVRRVFVMTVAESKKTFKVNGTSTRSFYRRVDHGQKLQFRSALMLKNLVRVALAASSSAV